MFMHSHHGAHVLTSLPAIMFLLVLCISCCRAAPQRFGSFTIREFYPASEITHTDEVCSRGYARHANTIGIILASKQKLGKQTLPGLKGPFFFFPGPD